ncbi:MAG: hypothetical protein ACLFR0_01800 [Alphaproteobacteria bacterium]
MADVFQEVDEMMKQERMERFWKENGRWIIAFVVLTILGTAAISVYKSWNTGVMEEQTVRLISILESEEFPSNAVEMSADLRAPLKSIALLSAAQAYQDDEQNNEALALYNTLAQDNAIPQVYRSMALIMSARMDENLSAEEKLDKLRLVFSDEDNIWRYHAYLEAAIIQAHANNEYKAARELLANIMAAPGVPSSLKEKAQKLDHVYETKMNIQAKAPADEKEGS